VRFVGPFAFIAVALISLQSCSGGSDGRREFSLTPTAKLLLDDRFVLRDEPLVPYCLVIAEQEPTRCLDQGASIWVLRPGDAANLVNENLVSDRPDEINEVRRRYTNPEIATILEARVLEIDGQDAALWRVETLGDYLQVGVLVSLPEGGALFYNANAPFAFLTRSDQAQFLDAFLSGLKIKSR
jgi:hypothetical protein